MFLGSIWKWVFSLVGVAGGVGLATGGYFLFSNLDKYKEYVITPLSDSPNDMVTAYYGGKLRGAEVILAPGYTHQNPIEQAFQSYLKDEFNDLGFLLYDSAVSPQSRAAANTWNITFRSDLGSIEVGVVAAYFLNYYQDTFLNNPIPGKTDGTLSFAMWGGQPFSSVTSFMGGFQKGIEWANENLKGKQINGKDYIEVEQVYSSDGQEFTGGFGASQGISLMSNIIKQRPDILMPVAGPQVWTAQDEIEKLGSKTVIIGVDSAVENDPKNKELTFTNNGEKIGNGKRVQFSSLKNLDLSTQIALEIINNGNKIPKAPADDPTRYENFSTTGTEGEIGGFGTIAVGDITNGLVGVSESGIGYLEEALKLANKQDPAKDAIYSTKEYMEYVGYKGEKIYNYFDDLRQEFAQNNETGVSNLNLEGFITKGNQSDSNKIKVALSTSESILMDSSFSQSCYTGLYYYFKTMDISIPAPVGIGGKN